jgi:hypothetical protein
MTARSFSILECLALLMLVATGAIVALPRLASEQIIGNEEEAVAFLRRIHQAQVSFHARSGTYGFSEELMGLGSARSVRLDPALLPLQHSSLGVIERAGYGFLIYLPSRDGHGARGPSDLDLERARHAFVAYGWPLGYGVSGRRVFAVGPKGVVLATDNALGSFSGPKQRPFVNLLGTHLGEDSAFAMPANWVTRIRWDPVTP